MSAGVELRGVSKAFGAVQAVHQVDFVAPTESLTALLGPSGCGKTTTLRLIAGFEAPDAGQVIVADQPVAGRDVWVAPERRRVGMVFQQLALFPHLDVAANLAYGLRGLDRRARRARVGELLELVGLSGYERRYPDQLSGGQAQRVAVARALAPRPTVLVLDEPFSSLDVGLRAELRTEVRRILATEGVTAVVVTHDQEEALSLGDEVVVMLEGRVAQVGTPDEVYRRPATPEVAAFLGEANFVHGQVRGGWMETELGAVGVEDDDGPRLALMRPENLELCVTADGPARVVDAQYHGHDQVVTVVLASGGRLRVRLQGQRRLEAGARVRVRYAGDEVVTFGAADTNGPAPASPVQAPSPVR
ncbi:MAG: ABC transporter ATP-binding protein [Actinomycetota bacterium]|nr:ABC transporter ATP-binding protein [Actinomycetota bacterium]